MTMADPTPSDPPSGGYYYTAPAPLSAPVPRVVPGFHGVPVRDYVTDVVALLLLLLSLGLPWNAATTATKHVEVILLTILSVLSLAVHYLYRVGVFPAGWSVRMVALLRAAINVPYLVLVVVTVILDLVAGLAKSSSLTPVVGGAAIVGLTGAVLAAVPRAAEVDDAFAAELNRWLRPTLLGLAAAAALFQVLGLIAPAIHDMYRYGGSLTAYLVIGTVGLGVVVVWALAAVARGDNAWRPVLLVATVALLFWALFVARDNGAPVTVQSGTLGLVVLPIAAPLATTPRTWQIADRRGYGHAAAGNALLYATLLAVFGVVLTIVMLTEQGAPTGTLVTILLLDLIIGVAAVFGRASLLGPTRVPTFAALGVILVLGIVILAVVGASSLLVTSWTDGLLAFGLPLTAAWALLLPASDKTFREAFAPAAAAVQAQTRAVPTAPAPGPAVSSPVMTPGPATASGPVVAPAPVAAPSPVVAPSPIVAPAPIAAPSPIGTAPTTVVPAAPTHGFTAEQASDPSTDPAVLAQIAAAAPELRAHLAANPATYPDLVQWLAGLHDPAVDAALAQRPS